MRPLLLLIPLCPVAPVLAQVSLTQASGDDELAEILIQAPEPRYVAPTNRDRIGRVWVPVYLNGKGPFRLVLDSGATRTAVVASVAQRLGLDTSKSPQVRLRGVTGTSVVPTIRVNTLIVGDLQLSPTVLPIVADAFGGAEGLLGTEGMADKRIYIDFRNDFINVSRSRNKPAEPGFTTLPLLRRGGNTMMVNATVGGVKALAIIDTGAQASVGNLALYKALEKRFKAGEATKDEIWGATGDMQAGEGRIVSPIQMGAIDIRSAHVTFGDMSIFSHWQVTSEPAVLIGMDMLGLVDTLVIDYKRRELMIKLQGRR